MKRSILCLVVLALGLSLSASSTSAPSTTSTHAPACCVDDPPPEPVECPMCGGNAQVHARWLVVIQQKLDCVAMLATRW